MNVFVNWWRNKGRKYIELGISHDRFQIEAHFDGRIPHLTLRWRIKNVSPIDVEITRISGELYIGAWRIGSFDSNNFPESHTGYSWNPLVAVGRKSLKKKGDYSEICITFFPSLELWLMDTYSCNLYNAFVELRGIGVTAVTKIVEDSLDIKNAEQIATQYRDSLRNRLSKICKGG
ncbi:MAG: hypothetical protein ABIK32_07460 [Chloroflexota bacterium]|nr:hypothetical protein [Chloroflexota bacterium]